jgi:hypothetical protein
LLVAFVLLPALVLTIWNCQDATTIQEKHLLTRLEDTQQNISSDLQNWHQQHLKKLQALVSGVRDGSDELTLPEQIQTAQQTIPEVRNFYVVDTDGANSQLYPKSHNALEFTTSDITRRKTAQNFRTFDNLQLADHFPKCSYLGRSKPSRATPGRTRYQYLETAVTFGSSLIHPVDHSTGPTKSGDYQHPRRFKNRSAF